VNAAVSERADRPRRTGSPGRAGRRQWWLLRLSPLRRRRRPRLDQRVVVDRLALRLLVGELALRCDVAVLRRLGEPELGGLLLVQLRTALLLHAALLETLEHGVLGRGQRVHRLLRRLVAGGGIADVLPPELRQLRIVRHVVAGRGPLHTRGRAV